LIKIRVTFAANANGVILGKLSADRQPYLSMRGIITSLNQQLLKLLYSAVLLLTSATSLTAQDAFTFEMTLPETPGITNLELIPGTKQFYACSQKVYADRIAPIVMKLDTAGNIVQQWEYDLAGIGNITRYKPTAGGGLLMLGGHNADTVYCLLLKANGDIAWCKSYYLQGQLLEGSDILETSDGGIIVSGSISKDNFQHDPFLLRLDKDGNSIWMRQFQAGEDRDALGSGIIQRSNAIIFCSTVATDDYPWPYNIRLSQVSLFDGSLLAVNDLLPEEIGFDYLKIYDDLHGGYYIEASSFIYRSPCQTAFILSLDSNLQLRNNFAIASAGIPQGFGVLADGTLHAGYQCFGYSPGVASSTLTKVSPEGQVVFSARYPGLLNKPPFSPDTLVIISSAVNIGNQVFVGGRKNGSGFISALNNISPGQNNCSLLNNDAHLRSEQFTTMPGEWTTVFNKTAGANTMLVSKSNPNATPAITTCVLPPVLYVDQNATGLNDGSSWQNAYTSFAAAIDKMNASAGIDSILVAAGTYTPAPAAAFTFKKLNAAILGGYPHGGGIRNASANKVILQGEVRFEQSVQFDGFKLQ
jgi:hypothetical protein